MKRYLVTANIFIEALVYATDEDNAEAIITGFLDGEIVERERRTTVELIEELPNG